MSVSHVSGLAHTAELREKDIRSATNEYFLLSLQTANTSRITQFGKSSILNPGDMALYASSDPYQLELSDNFSMTVVQLPKSKLIARLPSAHVLAAHTIDGQSGIGKLVCENIIEFSKHANEDNPALREMVQATLIDLIATSLASEIGPRVEISSPEQHVMLRAKSFIRGNLGDPNLDRTLVADEIGMSVRRLNAICAKEGHSIAEYIRAERIKRVALELRDLLWVCLSVSEIAMRNGFSNLRHFSTLVRGTYGVSPKSHRQNS